MSWNPDPSWYQSMTLTTGDDVMQKCATRGSTGFYDALELSSVLSSQQGVEWSPLPVVNNIDNSGDNSQQRSWRQYQSLGNDSCDCSTCTYQQPPEGEDLLGHRDLAVRMGVTTGPQSLQPSDVTWPAAPVPPWQQNSATPPSPYMGLYPNNPSLASEMERLFDRPGCDRSQPCVRNHTGSADQFEEFKRNGIEVNVDDEMRSPGDLRNDRRSRRLMGMNGPRSDPRSDPRIDQAPYLQRHSSSETLFNSVLKRKIYSSSDVRLSGLDTGTSSTGRCCAFCKNSGKPDQMLRSHLLKDADGRVTCPVLRSYQCPICLATGDYAHTLKYCPKIVSDQIDMALPPTMTPTKKYSTRGPSTDPLSRFFRKGNYQS